jgi:hypothetical protein
MTRNSNRTTKPERRAVRASNPTVSRAMGIGAAVRLHRQRAMRPEAAQLDQLARAMGVEPLMNESARPGVNHWAGYDARANTVDHWRRLLIDGETTVGGVTVARTMQGHRVDYALIDEPNPDDDTEES